MDTELQKALKLEAKLQTLVSIKEHFMDNDGNVNIPATSWEALIKPYLEVKVPTYTGKQSILNAALGEYADYGFSLVAPDDHTTELYFKVIKDLIASHNELLMWRNEDMAAILCKITGLLANMKPGSVDNEQE